MSPRRSASAAFGWQCLFPICVVGRCYLWARARWLRVAEPASTPRLDNPAVSREKSDVDLRRITYLGAGLTLTVVVILGLLLWLFDYFSERELRHGRTPQA